MRISILSACIPGPSMWSIHRGQKMAMGPLELDFQMVVRHPVGDGNYWESNLSPMEE